MKKIFFLIILACVFKGLKAQITFCPPGAEWHFLFTGSMFSPGNTYNEQIKYIGDSISGTDTLKILSHYRFFMFCSVPVNKTYIKQKGDTLFFRNLVTQGSWQILYNFAALPGQTWQTTVYLSITTPTTLTFVVDTVDQINENGFNLKRIRLTSGLLITERIGASSFLFPYLGKINGCDGNGFIEALCYQDSSFGLKQYSEKSCYYYTRNGVGINSSEIEAEEIEFCPNPIYDKVIVKLQSEEEFKIVIKDNVGRELKNQLIRNRSEIDLSELSKGIYFFQFSFNQGKTYQKKFIKE